MPVKAQCCIEPDEDADGDDESRVATTDIVGRAAVLGAVGPAEAPALLEDGASDEAPADHVVGPDPQDAVPVPAGSGSFAGEKEGSVRARDVVQAK